MFASVVATGEFVELVNNQLVFVTSRGLKLHHAITVRMSLRPFVGEFQMVRVRLYLHKARPLPGGRCAYVGSLLDALPFQPVANFDDKLGPLRKSPRLQTLLRVISLDMPVFAGWTVNFSRTGLQIETLQTLTPGRVSELRLSSPVRNGDSILLEARVAWCRSEAQSFRTGLEFRHVLAQNRERLARLEQFLRNQERYEMPSATINTGETECLLRLF